MTLFVANLFFGLATAVAGAAGATCWLWSYFRRKAFSEVSAGARRAAEVLVRLQELATRVAFDVDEHSSQVEEINDRLNSADQRESAMIVDVVAKLIQANVQMHEKLASTENKLREQAQAIQTHAAEARTDALTLLANRRAFDDEIARRTAESMRRGRTFSLILADVDHFKRLNDAHGHQAGDDVLRAVAKLLRRKMREMDMVARYGGEEFAIVLPDTDLAAARTAALRACEALEKAVFSHAGEGLRVTASFGVAELPGSRDAPALIDRADKALYAAKQGGRNGVYFHDGEQVHPVLAGRRPMPSETVPGACGAPARIGAEEAKQAAPASDSRAPRPKDLQAAAPGAIPGLSNRTTFCQQVRNRTAEWNRGGPTFSVVLLEVNQFAEGGGDRGHRIRKLATLTTTRFLAATIREMDVAGHYAPGCFALLLPTAGLSDAIRLAERLREGFARYRLPEHDESVRFTLSIGVVQVMENDDSISVLKRAETALDAAGRRGGDRVYYHDGERCAPITAMLETLDGVS